MREVWAKHWTGYPEQSADRLLQDAHFLRLVDTWAKQSFKFCNMSTERLLALIRKALSGDMPDALRVAACGFLTQLLREQRAQGRGDPRVLSRARLLASGAPLNVARQPARAKTEALVGSASVGICSSFSSNGSY